MGLDMYLYGIEYHNKRNNNLGKTQIIYTEEIYWRKANHIHRWFIENIQNNIDDCEEHEISKEQLEYLKIKCEEVMRNPNKASKILPTQEGFFFGETTYDNVYFEQTKRTIKEINRIIQSTNYDWFIYQSSW